MSSKTKSPEQPLDIEALRPENHPAIAALLGEQAELKAALAEAQHAVSQGELAKKRLFVKLSEAYGYADEQSGSLAMREADAMLSLAYHDVRDAQARLAENGYRLEVARKEVRTALVHQVRQIMAPALEHFAQMAGIMAQHHDLMREAFGQIARALGEGAPFAPGNLLAGSDAQIALKTRNELRKWEQEA
jgi:hypothetical protein